jgi:hypothetical protein
MGDASATSALGRAGGPSPGPFDQSLTSTAQLTVDVAHLDQLTIALRNTAKAIEDYLLPRLDQIDQDFSYGRGEGGTALGSLQIDNVTTLKQRHDSSQQAIKGSVQHIAAALQDTARAVGEFASRYATVEQRNAAGLSALNWRV